MLKTLRKRVRSEKGFTLIELLVVMIILGILTAIAVPSYLSFANRAKKSAAMADVRVILPSIEAYYADSSTYVGMTLAGLQSVYDAGINTNLYSIPSGDLTATSFCVQATVNGHVASQTGPSGTIQDGVSCA